jgi:type I restriction enzyme S subunit
MIEGPYKLPKGWRWVRLGEVARIFSGSPAPQDKRYFEEGFMPFVRVQDLGRYGITTNLTETADKINEEAVKELRLVKANKGTILFPKSGAAILTNSRAILGEDAYIVSHLAAVEPFHHVLETLWAFYWLCTVDMRQYIDNPAYPSLRLSKIRELLIPLPPLEEQKQIVARIEELMDRIKEAKKLRQETKKQIELLWQSVLVETFPQPGTQLPEGWRWVRLGEIAIVFSGTWGKEPSSQGNDEEALVRVIRVSDIKETLTIDYASVPWRCVTQKEVKRLALRDGDVIVVKSSGSQAKVISGRAALFEQQSEIFLPSNFVFAVRCNAKEVSPRFLWSWLNSEPLKQVIKQMVATFTYPNLKKSDYVNLPIPLPPLEEQKRIANFLQEVHEKIQELKEVQAKTEEEIKLLEQSILEKAFRGEL